MPRTSTPIQNHSQWKNERFFAVMDKFSIVQLFAFLTFTGFYAYIKEWQMIWISGASAAIWLLIFIRNHKQHNRGLFLVGSAVSIIFAAFATLRSGWNSGYFFLILSVYPIAFLNVHFKKTATVITAVIIGTLEVGLYLMCLFVPWIPDPESMWTQYTYGINLVFVVVSLSVIGYYFEKRAGEIEATLVVANKRLTNLAATDPVTNLANRRTMLSRIDQEKARLEKSGEAFTLIMIDIDNFKDINDEYGHDAGDFVLVNMAAIINFIVRKQDQVARWGGDEFLVFLPETRSEGGRVVAEKIRARILTTPFIYHEIDIPVTVTLGVSTCDSNIGIGNCIRKADLALYTGKQAGKNRVIIG